MRILFVSMPAGGHLIPLAGLARAARSCGHTVAVVTHEELASTIPDLELLGAGASLQAGMDEVERRGFPSPAQPGPGAVEMFGGAIVDLGFDGTVAHARRFMPDLIIGERFAFLAPLVADALGLPWAQVGISGEIPDELVAAFAQRIAQQYSARGIDATDRLALLDPYPELLHRADRDWMPAPDRVAIRPTVHSGGQTALGHSARPTALVTLGTSLHDHRALAAAVRSTLDAGFDAVVTEPPEALPALPDDLPPDRVRAVGFTPLAALLPAVDAVVTPGGTGTILAALSTGRPLVIRPVLADHPFNAERVSRLGLGRVVEEFDEVGPALREVRDDRRIAAAVRDAAEEINAIDPPEVVLQALLAQVDAGSAHRREGTSVGS